MKHERLNIKQGLTAILLTVILSVLLMSCEKEEPQIHDNSKLFIEISCDSPRFTYDLIINSDTINLNEIVLDSQATERATINQGDTLQLYCYTEEVSSKEINIYINSHLWYNYNGEAKMWGINYIIEN